MGSGIDDSVMCIWLFPPRSWCWKATARRISEVEGDRVDRRQNPLMYGVCRIVSVRDLFSNRVGY